MEGGGISTLAFGTLGLKHPLFPNVVSIPATRTAAAAPHFWSQSNMEHVVFRQQYPPSILCHTFKVSRIR